MNAPTTTPFPTRLYLVRHGETAWSLTAQHTGRTDLPLTSHGEDGARELAVRLSVGARRLQVRGAHNEGIRSIGHRAARKLGRSLRAAGLMGLEAEGAWAFVLATGQRAMTGSLDRIEDMLAARAGTRVSLSGGAL